MALQSLFMVAFGATVPVMQVSDFPERCSRSCEGALHIKPSSTAKLTQGEMEHIKAKFPKVAKGMKVVKKITPPPPAGEPPQAAAKAAAADTPSAALAAPSAPPSEPKGKGKGKAPEGASGPSEG